MNQTDTFADEGCGAAVEKARWKNLIFLKDGSTRFGEFVWSSATEAKAAADQCERLIRDWNAQGIPCHIDTMDGDVFLEDYSHAVQVAL
jgi:hypothetical protein